MPDSPMVGGLFVATYLSARLHWIYWFKGDKSNWSLNSNSFKYLLNTLTGRMRHQPLAPGNPWLPVRPLLPRNPWINKTIELVTQLSKTVNKTRLLEWHSLLSSGVCTGCLLATVTGLQVFSPWLFLSKMTNASSFFSVATLSRKLILQVTPHLFPKSQFI